MFKATEKQKEKRKKYIGSSTSFSIPCPTLSQKSGRAAKKPFIMYEPRHEKTSLCHMRTTKAQISLCIPAVWSAPLLLAV